MTFVPSAKLVAALVRSRELGFLGEGPVDRHVAHAASFAAPLLRNLRSGAGSADLALDVLDLGSGGGLPGLVLAELQPSWKLVLLDTNHRRTEFLGEAVDELGLVDRVTVVRGRAEEVGRDSELRGRFDAVTARSFGPPPVVCECAAPFLKVGGVLVVSEPPSADVPMSAALSQDPVQGIAGSGGSGEMPGTGRVSFGDSSGRWPEAGVALVGLEVAEHVSEPFALQVLVLRSLCPDRFPRRTGIPAKRPIYAAP